MALPPAIIGAGGGAVAVGITVTANTLHATRAFQQLGQVIGNRGSGLVGRVGALELQFRALDRVLQYLAVGSLVLATKKFLELSGEMERLQIRMSIFEGSSAAAAKRLDQVVQLASTAPFKIQTLADSFVKLKAAGLDPIVGADGSGPLKTLVDTVAAFGGSDEIFKRATIAIQQMAGKGVISMEELRQQLGEAVPNAIQLMAEGLGMSVSKLIYEVSRGNVAFEEGINAFLTTAEEKYKGAADLLSNTFFGALNQANSELTKLAINFNRAGGLDVFTAAIKMATEEFKKLNAMIMGGVGHGDAIEGRSAMQSSIASMFDSLIANSDKIAAVINVIVDLGRVIVAAIEAVTAVIPPEALTVGLLGYWFFGPAGFVVGAILSQFSGLIATIAEGIVALIKGTTSSLEAVGIRWQEPLYFGLVGWFLFGPTGGIVGALIGIVDSLIGYLSVKIADFAEWLVGKAAAMKYQVTNLFDYFQDEEGFTAGSNQAQADAIKNFQENFRKQWFTGPVEGRGPIGDIIASLQDVGRESGTTGDKVAGFFEKLREGWKKVGEARAQYEGQFGSANPELGLTQQQIQAIERLGQMQDSLDARLSSARSGGSEVAGFITGQLGKLREAEAVVGQLGERIAKLTSQGNIAGANQLKTELADVVGQIGRFRAGLGELQSIENQKIFEKIGDGIESLQARLEDISAESTMTPTQQKVAQVNKQFTQMGIQLEKLQEETQKLNNDSELYNQTLLALSVTQERLNQTWDEAIKRAEILGARQEAAAARQDDRAAKGFEDQAAMMEAQNSLRAIFDENFVRLFEIRQQFDALQMSVDDQIRTTHERLEDGLISQDAHDLTIERLEAVKLKFMELQEQAEFWASDAGELFLSFASTVKTAMGDAVENLITGAQSWKDFMNKVYADLTKAAANYIIKLIIIKMLEAVSGGFGGGMGGNTPEALGTVGEPGWNGLMFGAKGLVVPSGIKMMRKDDLIRGPTMFGMAGEAGTKAVMPLTRTKDGYLGVGDQGGGDKWGIHIHAMDAASVRDLFMREGSSLVEAITSRNRLNRGMRIG